LSITAFCSKRFLKFNAFRQTSILPTEIDWKCTWCTLFIDQEMNLPTLVILGSVKIQMFSDDHNQPHFHVIAPGCEAMILLEDRSVSRGSIRKRDLDIIREWASGHKDELNDLWSRLNDR